MNICGLGARLFTILLVSFGLVCCGTKVPDIKEFWDRDIPAGPGRPKIPGAAQIEFEIKKRVYCDLKKAVRFVNRYPVYESQTRSGPRTLVRKRLIPDGWGAQVSLSLQVEAASALNPGVTLINPMPNAVKHFSRGRMISVAQNFGLNLGGTLSSTATRIDKFDPYWTIEHLMTPDTPDSVCHPQNDPFKAIGFKSAKSSPFILQSDLGIKDWLVGAMFVNNVLISVEGQGDDRRIELLKKNDSVSYEIKFVIVSSGDVTPVWKLLRVSGNNRLPLFKTGRTRTHDLLITIGPQTTAARDTHLASQIGTAVGNANRAVLTSAREFDLLP